MTEAVIARRIAYHVGGYDPTTPEAEYARFDRELRRFEATWSVSSSTSGFVTDADIVRWQVETAGPDWRVATEFRFFRWDDLIGEDARRSIWRQIPLALQAFGDYLAGGALGGYLRNNWRYAGFFLYPFLMLATFVVLTAVLGVLVAGWAGSGLVGIAAGAAAFFLLVTLAGKRWYLLHLLNDWIFARDYIRDGRAVLDARLDRVARDIVRAAQNNEADEIVVIGHSLGAVLAVDLVDRAVRLDPDLGRSGTRVALISVGSSILKIGLHRGARRFHEAVARVADAAGLFWVEYQALTDIMNFYKTDPVVAMDLKAQGHPVIRTTRIRNMVSPEFYRRIRLNFFRVHCQFVRGNDRRTSYDYFMLLCGPFSAEAQAHCADGAASAIAADGTLIGHGAVEQNVLATPAQ